MPAQERADRIDKLYRLVQIDRRRWLQRSKSTLSQLLEQIEHGIFAYKHIVSTMPRCTTANLSTVLKRLHYQEKLARQILENTKRLRDRLNRRSNAKPR